MFMLQVLTRAGLQQLPSGYGEIVFLIFVMVLSMTAYAWAVGRISTLVMKQDNEIVIKRGQLELVHGYLAHTRVPAELAGEISAFFHARLKDTSGTSVRGDYIVSAIPVSLQIEIGRITRRHHIVQCALFRGCSDGFVDRLASLLRERRVEPDQVLFRTTEVCKELYIIESGSIRVFEDPIEEGGEPGAVTSLGAGETVGEVAFVFGLRHFNNAACESDADCQLVVLSSDNFRLLMKVRGGIAPRAVAPSANTRCAPLPPPQALRNAVLNPFRLWPTRCPALAHTRCSPTRRTCSWTTP